MSKDQKRKNGISSWCKNCRIISTKSWTARQDKSKYKVKKKLEREKNFNSIRQRGWVMKYRYNITLNEYDNLLKAQEYKCAVCSRDSRELTYFLHIDHCHTTNKVRGLLCAPCNTYLGYAKDDPQVFKNAIKYLQAKDQR